MISPAIDASSEEAAALLRNQTFDLVLLDLRMPGLNGFELVNSSVRESAVVNRAASIIEQNS